MAVWCCQYYITQHNIYTNKSLSAPQRRATHKTPEYTINANAYIFKISYSASLIWLGIAAYRLGENKSLAFSFFWIDTHVPNRSQHTHTHRFLLQRSDTIKREIMRAGRLCPERDNQSPAHHKSESRGQPITSTTTFLISPSFKGFD